MSLTTATNIEKGEIPRDSDEHVAKNRFIPGCTKGVDLAGRTVDGVASTINIDRDGEIILPEAFARTLPTFMASNAPFLAAHTHRGTGGKPTQIGWVIEARITKAEVICKFRFALGDTAEDWWKLASDPKGKGIAFSIGFYPRRWVYGAAEDLAREFPQIRPILQAAGLKDDDRLRVYTEIELLEISGVPAPSNREAIQILQAKFAKAFGYDQAEGEKAIDALAEAIAKKLSPGGQTDIIEQISALQRQLSDYHEDVLSILPDDVYGGGDPGDQTETETSRPGDRDPAKDAGGAEDGTESDAVREARKSLLARTQH